MGRIDVEVSEGPAWRQSRRKVALDGKNFQVGRMNIARKKSGRCVLIRFLVILWSTAAFAQGYQPVESNLKARQWFQDAKFGMFIHWGVYSVPGRGEWVMENEKIPIREYEKFAPQFNPSEFSAADIVSLAKAAGMKYITITSKHHDGFAMFATQQNKWNIVDATPYAKDPLKQLAEECRQQGIKLFFFHSPLD